MIALFLFPLTCIASIALAVAMRLKTGNWRAARGGPLTLVLTLAGCYVVAFVLLTAAPDYDDNGLPEFMELRHRWLWAGLLGGFFALMAVPVVFAPRAAWRAPIARARRRRARALKDRDVQRAAGTSAPRVRRPHEFGPWIRHRHARYRS